METRAPWFILGILLGASLFLPLLLAQDGASPWEQDERHLTFNALPDGFRYESGRDTESDNDLIQGTFSTLNRRFTMTYLDKDAVNMTPLRLSVDFEALVEYEDVDDDGSYSLGGRIDQRLRVADLPPPTQKADAIPGGGHRATYTYVLPGLSAQNPEKPEPTLEITFSVFPRPQMIGTELVPPTRPHTMVRVEHFPFQSNSSKIALETRLLGGSPLLEDGQSLYVSGFDRRLVYEWPGESLVDGDERPVHVTLLGSTGQNGAPNQSPAVVLQSYERGAELTYEPIIGARQEDPQAENVVVEFLTHGDWRLYAVGTLLAFGLVGATIWRRIERA